MNWLERYVHAVKRALPRGIREDAGDELYSLLEEKIVEAEAQQGAALTESALLDLLRNQGHPLLVAAGYQERRTLVGEALFPLYKVALKWLALVVFFLYVVHIVIDNLLQEVWLPHRVIPDLFEMYLIIFALVTLLFHFADRMLAGLELLHDWNPRHLPPLRATTLAEPVTALLCIAAWMIFLGAIEFDRSFALLLGRDGARFHTFVMWLQLHGLLTMLLYGWLLFRPWWDAQKLAASGAIGLLLAAGALHSQQLDPVTDFLVLGDRYIGTGAFDTLFVVVAVAGFLEALWCAYRILRTAAS